MQKEINFKKIEQKWQKKWEEKKVFEANPDKRKKFFVNFPYPYMNAAPHVGHYYTLMRVEAFARYKRMRGFNVLFAQGWHCTGSPIVAAAKRVEEKEEKQINALKDGGFSEKEILRFKDPEYWTKVFPKIWADAFSKIGISYDKRRSFITTSLNPYYDRFIRWQFNKLKEKGYVVKGKHPVVWDPKTNLPVGDHDRIKGEGETPQEFTLLKFKFQDKYLVAATLRPETVFGQTNLWVNPDGDYVEVQVDNERWIVSKQCADKLKEQEKNIRAIKNVKGKELMGEFVSAPGINREIIVLPANFVDPNIGTGIVTSVPSDAPYDYIALKELQSYKGLDKKYGFSVDIIEAIEDIEVIPIIETKKFGNKAGVKAVEDNKILSENDPRLEELTQEVYKEGFHTGIMLETCKEYKGMQVTEAKDKIKKWLIKNKVADVFYYLTGEVVSRSLTKCIVKIVNDQWFIKYGDKNWKKEVHAALRNVKLYPEVVREQFNNVIDWLDDWACTREYGLGTRLPFDEKWLIESLSDSTIYMAYYAIAHLIKEVPINKINDVVFDYILLNKGKKPAIKNIDSMKKEFEYWYPVDFRNSGKDLVQNHLAFFLFNHVAVFPKKLWPKSIGVNGWVKIEGEKMSKSLGNIIPLTKIADEFGADASRITILSGGEGVDDTNWDGSFVRMIKDKLNNLYLFAKEHYNNGRNDKKEIDDWLESEINRVIKETESFMELTFFRSAIQKAFFDLQSALKWYLRRADKPNKKTINRLIETQILLLSPFAPHICEEMWERIGKKGLIFSEKWPETVKINYKGNEDNVKKTLEDIKSILKIVKISPKKIYLYSIPNEIKFLDEAKLFFERELCLKVEVFAVNDKKKYDPQNKSSKAKPGRPAIFVE